MSKLNHVFMPEAPGEVPEGNPYKGGDYCWRIVRGSTWTTFDPEYCRRPKSEHPPSLGGEASGKEPGE